MSPLRILQTDEDKEILNTLQAQQKEETKSKQKFLKKGTGVNRSIMLNVLKAKCSQGVADSAYSHINYPDNDSLA